MKIECVMSSVSWFTVGDTYECEDAPSYGGNYFVMTGDDQDDENTWNLEEGKPGHFCMPGCETDAAFKAVEE